MPIAPSKGARIHDTVHGAPLERRRGPAVVLLLGLERSIERGLEAAAPAGARS